MVFLSVPTQGCLLNSYSSEACQRPCKIFIFSDSHVCLWFFSLETSAGLFLYSRLFSLSNSKTCEVLKPGSPTQPYPSILTGNHLLRLPCAFECFLHAILGCLLQNFWGGRDLKGHHVDCPALCSKAHSLSIETIICSIKDIRELRGLIQAVGPWTDSLHSMSLADVVKALQVALGYSLQDLETEDLLLQNPVFLSFSLHQNHLEVCET